MTRQRSRRSHWQFNPVTGLPVLVLLSLGAATGFAQQVAKPDGGPASATPTGQDFALRGKRTAGDIRYSDWHKVCFKAPGTDMVCRTSINGKFETGQSAVRIGLIEREGDKAARLQMFLPVGLYLQAGVTITIDQGAAYRFPYVWCLTNACIAAGVADPRLIAEMETGETLLLKVADTSALEVSTTVPIDQFAAVRRGAAAQTLEQSIDE